MWAFVHLTFLTGFKNRWIALGKWLTAFVGSARDERTITMQQASARIVAMRAGVKIGEEDLSRFVDERSEAELAALLLATARRSARRARAAPCECRARSTRPRSSTSTSSTSSRPASRWVISSVARSRVASSRSATIASAVACRDAPRARRGSSSGKSASSARAIARRWRWPPDMRAPRSPSSVFSPVGQSSRPVEQAAPRPGPRRSSSALAPRLASRRFSSSVLSNTCASCEASPTTLSAVDRPSSSAISTPSSVTEPLS